ncbi:MAG TPA: heme NO-binding domain-containing protein [Polyangiales bacterium]|nr:heme NO-binding domain-containing protein [Polyangiales bacterium]
MYGLLNAALKEFVATRYGADTWLAVAERAGVSDSQFSKMDPYPDELTAGLISATVAITRDSPEQVLEGFGEYWVMYTANQGYRALFEIAGDSLRDFLLSLDALHERVGRSFPKLVPPTFRFDNLDARTLRMHYLSTRKNLCPMIPGLLKGLSLHFNTPIQVVEDACARRGADHCEFIVTVSGKGTESSVAK